MIGLFQEAWRELSSTPILPETKKQETVKELLGREPIRNLINAMVYRDILCSLHSNQSMPGDPHRLDVDPVLDSLVFACNRAPPSVSDEEHLAHSLDVLFALLESCFPSQDDDKRPQTALVLEFLRKIARAWNAERMGRQRETYSPMPWSSRSQSDCRKPPGERIRC